MVGSMSPLTSGTVLLARDSISSQVEDSPVDVCVLPVGRRKAQSFRGALGQWLPSKGLFFHTFTGPLGEMRAAAPSVLGFALFADPRWAVLFPSWSTRNPVSRPQALLGSLYTIRLNSLNSWSKDRAQQLSSCLASLRLQVRFQKKLLNSLRLHRWVPSSLPPCSLLPPWQAGWGLKLPNGRRVCPQLLALCKQPMLSLCP